MSLRVPLRPQINFETLEITYKSEIRFLGIYITENLTFGTLVRFVRAKLCKIVYMIKTLNETLSPYMIRNIYFQILSPVSDMVLHYEEGITNVINSLNCKKSPSNYQWG
jgi:hypothetical protein